MLEIFNHSYTGHQIIPGSTPNVAFYQLETIDKVGSCFARMSSIIRVLTSQPDHGRM